MDPFIQKAIEIVKVINEPRICGVIFYQESTILLITEYMLDLEFSYRLEDRALELADLTVLSDYPFIVIGKDSQLLKDEIIYPITYTIKLK